MQTRPLFAISFVAILAACASVPTQQDSIAHYQVAQKEAALKAEKDGHLFSALTLWRSVATIDSQNGDTQSAISRLTAKIEAEVKVALSKGKSAYKQSNRRRGDGWMLKVLSLHPGHVDALDALRRSVSFQAREQQASKSAEEYEIIAARQAPKVAPLSTRLESLYKLGDNEAVLSLAENEKNDLDDTARAVVRAAHIALADQAKARKEYDLELEHVFAAITTHLVKADPLIERAARLRVTLSDKWYRVGLGRMKQDLRGAITALEKSLDYNPQNTTAKRKLLQAKTLENNLLKIQQR